MRYFMIYTLIFAILSCTAVSLFAYNDIAKKTVNKTWAKCLAEDTDGPLFAESYIEADIDYPGEGDNFVEKAMYDAAARLRGGYGIHLEAYARVKSKAPIWNGKVVDDYGGNFDLYASVCFDDDPLEGPWEGEVDENVRAEDFIFLDEENTNWDTLRANNELYPWAEAYIDGNSPEIVAWKWVEIPAGESGSQTKHVKVRDWVRSRPAFSHNAVADVWDFSFSDATEWNCYLSGDTTCPKCGE